MDQELADVAGTSTSFSNHLYSSFSLLLFIPRDASQRAVMPRYVVCPSVRSTKPSLSETVQDRTKVTMRD